MAALLLLCSACSSGEVGGPCEGADCDPACAEVICDDPPVSACSDDTLISYSAQGRCEQGICLYQNSQQFCPEGCTGGACIDSLCTSVVCTTPPASSCTSGVQTTYQSPGTCSGGDCSYSSSTQNCPSECATDGLSCEGDPCASVTCDTPPSPTCSGGVLTTYAATGNCAAGNCSYPSSTVNCAEGCNAGATGCASGPGQDWDSYTWTDATGESATSQDCTTWLNATSQAHTGVRVLITARDEDDAVLWTQSIPGACAYIPNGGCGYAAFDLVSAGGTASATPTASCAVSSDRLEVQTQITSDATAEASEVPYEGGWVDATGQSNISEDCLAWLARTSQGTTSRHLYNGVVIPRTWAMCATIDIFGACARGVSHALHDSRWHGSCQTTTSTTFPEGMSIITQTR